MKKINLKTALASVAISAVLFPSCYKKFDPASYAPPLNIGGYTTSKEVGQASLVGYWSFDNNLLDSVSNTAGTNTGTSFVTGIKGMALKGAENAYVVSNVPTAIQNLHSFTVTSWVNAPQNTNGIAGILDIANANSFWGNLSIFFENGGTADLGELKIHINNKGKETFLGNYDLSNPWNNWMNIAVTYDETSSTFKVFVNGSKIATQTVANYGPLTFQNANKMVFGTVQFQTTPSLTSGATSQSWASYLTGSIDEVRIFSTALSESDVNALVKLEGRGK